MNNKIIAAAAAIALALAPLAARADEATDPGALGDPAIVEQMLTEHETHADSTSEPVTDKDFGDQQVIDEQIQELEDLVSTNTTDADDESDRQIEELGELIDSRNDVQEYNVMPDGSAVPTTGDAKSDKPAKVKAKADAGRDSKPGLPKAGV